jgi:transposase-like protein
MSCCGEPRGAPRHRSSRCPRCASARVTVYARKLSLAWYACSACGYLWQDGE